MVGIFEKGAGSRGNCNLANKVSVLQHLPDLSHIGLVKSESRSFPMSELLVVVGAYFLLVLFKNGRGSCHIKESTFTGIMVSKWDPQHQMQFQWVEGDDGLTHCLDIIHAFR